MVGKQELLTMKRYRIKMYLLVIDLNVFTGVNLHCISFSEYSHGFKPKSKDKSRNYMELYLRY